MSLLKREATWPLYVVSVWRVNPTFLPTLSYFEPLRIMLLVNVPPATTAVVNVGKIGFTEAIWSSVRAHGSEPGCKARKALRRGFNEEQLQFQAKSPIPCNYLQGWRNRAPRSPDPGNIEPNLMKNPSSDFFICLSYSTSNHLWYVGYWNTMQQQRFMAQGA